jgi:hypothetical protein
MAGHECSVSSQGNRCRSVRIGAARGSCVAAGHLEHPGRRGRRLPQRRTLGPHCQDLLGLPRTLDRLPASSTPPHSRSRSSTCPRSEHHGVVTDHGRMSISTRHGALRWARESAEMWVAARYGADQLQIAHGSHGNGQTAHRLAAQRLDRVQQLCPELFDPCGACRRVGSQCDGPESALGQRVLTKSVLLHL